MEDGCKNDALPVSSSSGSLKHCSVCGVAVKDHLGPHGPAKCLVKLIELLSQCIERLGNDKKRQADELQLQSRLHVERQEALLATIEALDERVVSLEQKVVALEHASVKPAPTGNVDSGPPVSTSTALEHEKADSPPASSNDLPLVGEARTDPTQCVGKPSSVKVSFGVSSAFSEPGGADRVDDDDVPADDPSVVAVEKPVPLSWSSTVAGSRTSLDQVCDGFQLVGKNGRPVRHASKDRRRAGHSVSQRGRLKGAVRVRCMPFHLSGISLESDADDIVSYCRSKAVVITGCYLIRSRIWGTQSAKIYVDKESKELVLGDSFWPTHLKCRVWEPDAPSSRRALLDPSQTLE